MASEHFHFPVDMVIQLDRHLLSLGEPNRAELGIFRNVPLKNSKTAKAGVRTLASVGRGIPLLQANYQDVGIFEQMSVADSFASVYDAHVYHHQRSYRDFIEAEVYASGDLVLHAWFLAKDGMSYKRASNAIAGIAKRAYAQMAYELRFLNSPRRMKMKGFSLYAIGTGQTMQAITGRVKRV